MKTIILAVLTAPFFMGCASTAKKPQDVIPWLKKPEVKSLPVAAPFAPVSFGNFDATP